MFRMARARPYQHKRREPPGANGDRAGGRWNFRRKTMGGGAGEGGGKQKQTSNIVVRRFALQNVYVRFLKNGHGPWGVRGPDAWGTRGIAIISVIRAREPLQLPFSTCTVLLTRDNDGEKRRWSTVGVAALTAAASHVDGRSICRIRRHRDERWPKTRQHTRALNGYDDYVAANKNTLHSEQRQNDSQPSREHRCMATIAVGRRKRLLADEDDRLLLLFCFVYFFLSSRFLSVFRTYTIL